MSNFIIFSGILAFLLLIITIATKIYFKKWQRWHRHIGYAMALIATAHGAVALYRFFLIYYM